MFFLAGVVVSYILSEPGQDRIERWRRRVTWRAFGTTVRRSVTKLAAKDVKPDVIIGVNSGIVPASIMALNLRVNELRFLAALPSYVDGKRVQDKFDATGWDLAGKRILVVDDQSYTGKSLEACVDHLVALGIPRADIDTHVLYQHRSGAGRSPVDVEPIHYVAGGVKVMPWVILESMRGFWSARESRARRGSD